MSSNGSLRALQRGFNSMLNDVPQPPCDRNGRRCAHIDRCGSRELACRDFLDFVRFGAALPPPSVIGYRVRAGTAGSDRTPYRRIYRAVFPRT